MRVLIVGASGLIGSHLMGAAGVRCIEGVGTYRHHPKDGLIRLDLADQPATERLLDSVRPDWVVHAAGWTWVDGCEKDPARAVDENCTQPVRLARACRDRGIRFGYLSTTYIFDGESGPYSEDAIPRPINEYGRSKWSAECRLQEVLDGRALIFRTICVWGFEEQQKNFVYQVIKELKKGRTMRLPADQLGNPTWAGDVADWVIQLIKSSESGVWNLASSFSSVSRVEWFRAIRDALVGTGQMPIGLNSGYEACITADLLVSAPRPLQASADVRKIMSRFPKSCRHFSDIGEICADVLGVGAEQRGDQRK
jgi:dTDP-4-dehydrorhamnose reductase